ncbi:MAG: 4Fe-4S binding protein [Candidatus Aenigmarchaeota archaeon]
MGKNSGKGGVTSRPTTSNKKSGWRTFRPVFTDKCTGCGICVMYCPEGCIKIKRKKAKPDYDYCAGCLICVEVCPVKAIESKMED